MYISCLSWYASKKKVKIFSAVCLFISLLLCLFISLSLCLSVFLSSCLSVFPSFFLFLLMLPSSSFLLLFVMSSHWYSYLLVQDRINSFLNIYKKRISRCQATKKTWQSVLLTTTFFSPKKNINTFWTSIECWKMAIQLCAAEIINLLVVPTLLNIILIGSLLSIGYCYQFMFVPKWSH